MPIHLTPSIKFLIILCFGFFILQQTGDQFFGTHLYTLFALSPKTWVSHYAVWQFFTYPFIHTDVLHLFFNLLMLASIGSELEALWGTSRFLRYYFFCAWVGAAAFMISVLFLSISPSLAGSSGPIYGLLLAYGLVFGERVMLFMMLFPMKAKHFVWLLALIELMTTLYSSGGIWAGFAQLTGMAAGLGYLLLSQTFHLRKKVRSGSSRRSRPGHLKLVVRNEDSDSGPKTWH